MFFYGDDTVSLDTPPAYCKLDDFLQETDDCTVGARSWPAGGTPSAQQDLSARFSGRMGQGEVAAEGGGRMIAVWGGTSRWGGVGGTVLQAREIGERELVGCRGAVS
jgi:hypothetical protein